MMDTEPKQTAQHVEAQDFARTVVQMVIDSSMHKLLTLAAILSAIADNLVNVECEADVCAVRQLVNDIRQRSITVNPNQE